MKTNRLIALFVITVIVVAGAIVTTHWQTPTKSKQKAVLFPDFKTNINNVNEISIQQGQKSLTVINEGGNWKIREADGYPALFSKVKQTVLAVSGMEVISQKTENPALYPKLGVEDPGSADAKSSLLTLNDAGGNPLVSLIVGNPRLSPAASDSHGVYVRLPDKQQALLVESDLQASVSVADWIDRDLINISPDRISGIHIVHGDDQDVSYGREKDNKNLVLENIPKGKQPRSDYIQKRMQGILEDVRIDGVMADTKIKFPDTAVATTVQTTDGLTAVIYSTTLDDKHYAKITFQYNAPAKAEQEPTDIKSTAGDKDKAKADTSKIDDVAKEVAELSAKTAGWVYQLPAYKFDTFTRKLDDLVEDIPKKETENSEAKD